MKNIVNYLLTLSFLGLIICGITDLTLGDSPFVRYVGFSSLVVFVITLVFRIKCPAFFVEKYNQDGSLYIPVDGENKKVLSVYDPAELVRIKEYWRQRLENFNKAGSSYCQKAFLRGKRDEAREWIQAVDEELKCR